MSKEILCSHTCDVSEFKKDPIGKVANGYGEPVAILDRNQVSFYCVPAELYGKMQEAVETPVFEMPEETEFSKQVLEGIRYVVLEKMNISENHHIFHIGDIYQSSGKTTCHVQPLFARALLIKQYYFDLLSMGWKPSVEDTNFICSFRDEIRRYQNFDFFRLYMELPSMGEETNVFFQEIIRLIEDKEWFVNLQNKISTSVI